MSLNIRYSESWTADWGWLFCSCFCLCLFFPFVLFYSLPPCGFSPNTRHFVCLLCFDRVFYFIYQMSDSLSYPSRNNTLHGFVHHLNQCFYMILYLYVNWIIAKTHDVYSEYERKESNRYFSSFSFQNTQHADWQLMAIFLFVPGFHIFICCRFIFNLL